MTICATTLGETGGDLLSMTLNIGYAVSSLILISIFAATLVVQLLSRRFHPVLYWTAILSTSTAGTTMSDFIDRPLKLGCAEGSLILVSGLVVVLSLWRWSEKSIEEDCCALATAILGRADVLPRIHVSPNPASSKAWIFIR